MIKKKQTTSLLPYFDETINFNIKYYFSTIEKCKYFLFSTIKTPSRYTQKTAKKQGELAAICLITKMKDQRCGGMIVFVAILDPKYMEFQHQIP